MQQCIYTIGTSSASHTYGNVASCLREMIIKYFPENFFTYVYMDSTIAWKNIAEVLGITDREFRKRHYPFLIITPHFDQPSNDDNMFLSGTPLTNTLWQERAGLLRNTLFPVIIDRANEFELCYKLNRDKLEFDVELRLKSQVQQIDVRKNLENQIMWDMPHLRPVALESMIPRSMIEYMAKIGGIDWLESSEDDNKVPATMRFLNAHSKTPITYKIRNSTAVEEFFMYYRTKLLVTFSDLSPESVVKKNSVDEYCALRFRVSVEFNMPGLYALIGTHQKKFHGLKFDAMVHTGTSISELIPIYTYTNLYDRFEMDTCDGYTFYSSTIVQTDKDKRGKDEIIDMREIIPPDHMRVLDRILDDGVPPGTIFRFRLLKNSKELNFNCEIEEVHDCEWSIDWKKRRIIIHKSDPLVTYRIITYANLIMINERFAHDQDIGKKDKPGL